MTAPFYDAAWCRINLGRQSVIIDAWRCGHVAVAASPYGATLHGMEGDSRVARPWMIVHVATGACVLDANDVERAWFGADQLSLMIGYELGGLASVRDDDEAVHGKVADLVEERAKFEHVCRAMDRNVAWSWALARYLAGNGPMPMGFMRWKRDGGDPVRCEP